jgi:hypothetical protein
MTEVTERLNGLEKRLAALEENFSRHERVIKRAIEIAGAYILVE